MTAALARDGDVIDPLGMDVSRYMQNPVVLWMHGWSPAAAETPAAGIPIGRTLALRRDASGIEADFEFLEGDPFAARVRNAWERGFLRTASISWLTLEARPLTEGGRGLLHSKTELLEWSLVPVPADPNASRELHAAGLRSLGYPDLVNEPQSDCLTRLVEASQLLGESLAGKPERNVLRSHSHVPDHHRPL